MTSPEVKARVGMTGEYQFKYPRDYGPPVSLRVQGDGLKWSGWRKPPTRVPDLLYHSEFWMEEKDGVYTNRVPKRKSKKRFPDLPPLKSG